MKNGLGVTEETKNIDQNNTEHGKIDLKLCKRTFLSVCLKGCSSIRGAILYYVNINLENIHTKAIMVCT